MILILLTLFGGVLVAGFSFYLGGAFERRSMEKKNQYSFQQFLQEPFIHMNQLLQFDRQLQNILDSVMQAGLATRVLLFRSDGDLISDPLREEAPLDQPLREVFRDYLKNYTHDTFGERLDDFAEIDQDHPLFQSLVPASSLPQEGCIYPIFMDHFGIRYYLLVFYPAENISPEYRRNYLQVVRQLVMVLYLREISRRYRENIEFLDGVFQKNPVAMCMTDTQGHVVKSNRGFSKLFGHRLVSIQALLSDGGFERLIEGELVEKDYLFENRNLKVRGTPLYSSEGVIRGCFFTLLDDSLQYLLFKKLEASEERYKKLLKELPVGLVIVNHEGAIYFVNDNFMNHLGFEDPEALMGNHIGEFFEMPMSDFSQIALQVENQDYLFMKFSLKNRYGNRIFSVHLQKIFLGEDELIEAIFQDVSLENKLYAQLEEKSKVIEEDLNTARLIWEHILSIPPIYSSLLRFETFFKPSAQLGGDFYDVLQIDDVHVGVLIADVSGHGVSASLITSMLKMLVELAPKDPHRIDDMMGYFNLVLLRVLPEDQFITMFFGIIDTRNYSIEYVNCGHPSPLVYDEKKGTVDSLKGATYPLGTKKNVNFSESVYKQELPANCRILFYTDGLMAFRKSGHLMRLEDLEEVFKANVHLQAKELLNELYVQIMRSSAQITDDDVSMMLVSFSRDLGYKKSISIPSNVLEIDNAIVKLSESIQKVVTLDDEERWKLYTALYEAIINAVEHGNEFNVQKRVSVVYRIWHDFLVFKIKDEGGGFDSNRIPNPLDESNLLKPSGRGVYMIRKIMNKVRYNKLGNEVTMYLKLKKGLVK